MYIRLLTGVYIHVCIFVNFYIEVCVCTHTHIYIYIYLCVYRVNPRGAAGLRVRAKCFGLVSV